MCTASLFVRQFMCTSSRTSMHVYCIKQLYVNSFKQHYVYCIKQQYVYILHQEGICVLHQEGSCVRIKQHSMAAYEGDWGAIPLENRGDPPSGKLPEIELIQNPKRGVKIFRRTPCVPLPENPPPWKFKFPTTGPALCVLFHTVLLLTRVPE